MGNLTDNLSKWWERLACVQNLQETEVVAGC
jgi:hypothetical protein